MFRCNDFRGNNSFQSSRNAFGDLTRRSDPSPWSRLTPVLVCLYGGKSLFRWRDWRGEAMHQNTHTLNWEEKKKGTMERGRVTPCTLGDCVLWTRECCVALLACGFLWAVYNELAISDNTTVSTRLCVTCHRASCLCSLSNWTATNFWLI